MTTITIDPVSLDETAAVFRTAVEVLNELAPQVARTCDGVWAPPGIADHARLELSTVALTLQTVALELLQEAGDLNRRATCCCQGDSGALPLPGLVSLAFGAAPALAPQHMIQFGSAVSPVAAAGPGAVEAPAMSAPAAAPVSLHQALAGTTLGGSYTSYSSPLHQALANGNFGSAPASPISLHQALAGGTFGGGPTIPTSTMMVYDPSYNPMAPLPGIGELVYDPNSPSVGHTAATMPRVPLGSPLLNPSIQRLTWDAYERIYNPSWVVGYDGFVGG